MKPKLTYCLLFICEICLTLVSSAQVPWVKTYRFTDCEDIESYFRESKDSLSPIEGVWAIKYTLTQKSPLYSESKIDDYETTFYIIRAIEPNDCFGVYVCNDGVLKQFAAIQGLGTGLYMWGWTPKTCERSDMKQFRVRNGKFDILIRDLSNRLKKQIFTKIGSNVKVSAQIEGEILNPDEY